MLIIGRLVGQKILIGDDIVITVVERHGNQVKIGIDAPRELRISRDEPATNHTIQADNQIIK